MKRKSLLFLLLMAIFAPWAAMAQTLTIYDGEPQTTNRYVPIDGYNVDGTSIKSECVIPASQLTAMNGKEITQMTYYLSTVGNRSWGNATFKVFLKEVEFTTISSLQGLTGATVVYDTKGLDCTQSTMDVVFDNPYTYNGGNLLVGVYIVASGTYTGTSSNNGYKPLYAGQTVSGASYHSSGGQQNFIPKTTFTYEVPPCCPKPKDLACTGYTATTATFTWTNGGEETQWLLEYAMDEDFTNPTQVTVNQSDLVNGAYTLDNNLTTDQQYYARIKAWCPSCGAAGEYSDASNTCPFKPSATFCDDLGTGTESANLVYTSWGCTYSQHIYTADELTDMGFSAGEIVSVSFRYSGSSSTYQKTQSIYMGTTTKSSYSGYTASDFESEVTLVYGPEQLSYVAGWREYELTEPFTWDGTSNIVVGMLTNGSNQTSSSGWSAYGTSTSPDYRSIYRYRDSTPIDITDLASVNNGNMSQIRPNMHLCITPSTKPRNLTVSNLSSSGATLAWDAPAGSYPTGYEYQYKTSTGEWPTAWTSNGTNLSVPLSGLTASTSYTFRVRATYAESNGDPVEITFTTLDDCAYPTNLVATTTPGQGTKATLTWVKGYDEEAWVLEYATNADFTEGLVEVTDGFTVEGNNVTANLTGLTSEQTYYARVKANCDGPTSSWSDVAEFTPTNYVDYTYNQDATSSTAYGYVPFYGSYVAYATHSRFIIPSTSLADIAGGTVKKLTFYSSTANADWGNATFKVYVAEVDNATFSASPSTTTPFDWSEMTQVYSGSLSLANGMMEIVLDDSFVYSGTKNLMIGFEETNTGTNATASWYYKTVSNSCAYAYKSYSSATSFSTNRNGYSPKLTFNYLPTPYVKIAAINEGEITSTTAELTWTAPQTTATITGYAYQYKLSSAAEWPTAWSNLAASATSVTLDELTSGSSYDFRIKVLYEGNHESAVTSTSFFTDCEVVTAFPWKEDFEGYNTGNFSHPCWVNQHISGDGSYLYSVVTESMGDNNTKKLKLNDQSAGTETMLRLPEMNLPGNDYQFVIDVYRNTNTYQEYPYELEGIHVYVSTNGNLEGATELAYIPRHKDVSNSLIPAEEETGWYTYEIPVGISGNCYIILKGVNQWCTSIYMDNFGVEQIPTCARPTDLAKSEVTNHSATLTWTAGDPDQHNWQVAYSKTSFDPNTANFDLTTVETVDFTTGATCTYRMDKLFDAESTYYLYIRANCGTATEPDYGPWSRKGINLTTLVASPAPSNFTASNIGSQTADLVWTAGGGDYELSWDLYYVQSDDAPTAPTEETPAKKTVTTLPTTENPYTLDGLTEESRYYIWVRANHTINSVTTPSAWVALTDNYFTTLAACPTPTGLAYNNLTAVSADLSWVGSPDVTDYTVQYRLSEKMVNPVLDQEFGSSAPTGWTGGNVALDEGVADVSEVTSNNWSFSEKNSVLNGYHAWMNLWTYSSVNYWLVTPGIAITEGQVLSFDVAYTAYGDGAPVQNCTTHSFGVYASTDKKNWTPLRVWDNSGSPYVLDEIDDEGQTVSGISLNGFADETIYIGFLGHAETSSFDNNIHVDNVKVASVIPAGPWTDATTDETSLSYTLPGLTAGTKYDVQVKSNCTNGEWSTPITFTTLADGNKVFTNAANDGLWGTAGNWVPTGAPVLTDNAILRANATIESGCVAQAKQITFQGSPTPTLTIENGGQLQHDNTSTITATVKKTIAGYGSTNANTNNGYVLFAPPFGKSIYTNNSDGTGLRNGTYDLYNWSRTSTLEWTYYGSNNTSSLYMSRGTGYLYACEDTREITFTGSIYGSGTKLSQSVYYTAPTAGTTEFSDWNLIGNPFVCNAYLATETGTPLAYYKMNDEGNGFEAVTNGAAIAPMQGIFYQATEAGSVYFYRELPSGSIMPGNLNINLTQAVTTRGEKGATDNAIIRFGEGNTLGKFSFREGSSKVYIPMEGKDYAVVNAEGKTGEIPVNFKAEKNGSYTLSFTSQEVTFSYLHLIDNLTGNDVDLLANPSYSFDAQVTDYAQRFKLVFATGSSVDGDSFGFINGSGNLCIFGIEGEATIQVIDILGHVVTSDTFSGSYERKLNVAPGVYMIRLINGNDVKVQKIVVR